MGCYSKQRWFGSASHCWSQRLDESPSILLKVVVERASGYIQVATGNLFTGNAL